MTDPTAGACRVVDRSLLRSAPGRWFGRPSLTARPDGTWVLVFRAASQHGPGTDSAFHVAFSADEGETWTDDDTTLDGESVEGFPHTSPDADVSDATVKHHDGDLLFHVTEEREPFGEVDDSWRGTRQLRSTDGGVTWTDEGILDPDGIDAASLLLGQDGTVDPENGDRYEAVFVTRAGDRSAPFKSGLARTPDGGRSWEYVSDVTGFEDRTDETGVAFVGGDLLAVLRDTDDAETYVRRSTDCGKTWGALETVTDALGVIQRPRVYSPDDVGSEAHNSEWLFLLGRHVRPEESQHTAVAVSPDAGRTWDGPVDLDEFGWPAQFGDCGYCDLRTRADGDHYLVTYGGPSSEDADLLGYTLRES
jgi:hypothetical protein